jgi:hypothetical protein
MRPLESGGFSRLTPHGQQAPRVATSAKLGAQAVSGDPAVVGDDILACATELLGVTISGAAIQVSPKLVQSLASIASILTARSFMSGVPGSTFSSALRPRGDRRLVVADAYLCPSYQHFAPPALMIDIGPCHVTT